MSALGHTFRYQVQNQTGGTVVVTVTERRWKFDTDGSIIWSTEQTPISAASVTTGAFSNSSTIDNSTDKYLGATHTVLFDVSGTLTGAVTLFLQRSTDGGTDWPSNGGGQAIGSYYFNASSTDFTSNFSV